MAAAAALTSYLYSGEQFDVNIGQQYLRARYYDAATGRFNRADPFLGNTSDPQSFHKYLYTHADPISGVDPTGQFVLSVSLAAFGGASLFSTAGAARAGDFWSTSRSILGDLFPNADVDGMFTLANAPAPGDWFFTRPVPLWEALIPIWGPLRSAAYDAAHGEPGWAFANLFFAGLDVISVTGFLRALPGVARSVTTTSINVARNATGHLIQRFGGVLVRKAGNVYIKTVDDQASGLLKWFGQTSIEEQVRALIALGDDAPQFIYENGRLIIEDVGKFSGGFLDWLGRFITGSRKLGTFFNDIRPRNIGALGQIFDPALHPLGQMAYATMLELTSILGKTTTWTLTYDDD